jgi:tripartite-type tricarboxylate transporter receptor subunit TctC
MAVMVPLDTPPSIRARLEAALAATLAPGSELAVELDRLGLPPRFRDGMATRAFIEAERRRYGALIRDAGIRPDG